MSKHFFHEYYIEIPRFKLAENKALETNYYTDDGDVPNTWDGYIKVYVTEKELINKYLIS